MHVIRLLFWLKSRLTFREYRRSSSALLGAILMLVILLPISIGMAAVCGFALRSLYTPQSEDLLRAIVLGIYCIWLMAPMLGYNLNDSYDITRLFVYPLSLRQILTGAIFGSICDMPTLLLLPTLFAILFGFSSSLVACLITICALALFLFHTLAMSQAVLLLTSGMLRTRRFRDALAVLLPALAILYYITTQALLRQSFHINIQALLASRVWNLLNFIPPGFAARAIIAGNRGSLAAAAANLFGLAAVTLGAVYFSAWMLNRVYQGDSVGGKEAPSRETQQAAASWPRPDSGVISRLPAAIAAVYGKERRYIARDPFFKMFLGNLVYMLVIAVCVFVNPMRQGGGVAQSPLTPFLATLMLLMMELQLLANTFGTEGHASVTLFLYPCPRRHILMGKNLAYFCALSITNLIFTTVLSAVSHSLPNLPSLYLWLELATLICMALGNLASIFFPVRLVLRGWRLRQQSSSRSFGMLFLYLGVMCCCALVLAPLLIGLAAPLMGELPIGWLALIVPAGICYAAGLYALSIYLAGPLLEGREQQIVARLTKDGAS